MRPRAPAILGRRALPEGAVPPPPQAAADSLTPMPDPSILVSICRRFLVPGDIVDITPYGTGHINQTFVVTTDQAGQTVRYLLQRLNTGVFQRPREVMANIVAVTGHIRRRLEEDGHLISRRVLTLIHSAEDEAPFVEDPEHGFWRCYLFIEGARTYDVILRTEQAFEAAKAFGAFQYQLSDYAGPALHETIPQFHHTPTRLQRLREAAAQDVAGRLATCGAEVDFALARSPLAETLVGLAATGEIPLRITHNDTKLNNVMLDQTTGQGICVVDLDTVMPGHSLCDFGDMVRTACNPLAEDDPHAEGVVARADMFEALARGYLVGTAGTLRPVEREHLAVAGQLLTYECGVRFLTDHLQGDTYFRTHRPGQNLDRARNQFALLRSLESQAQALMDRIRDLV